MASQPLFVNNRWYHVVYVADSQHNRQIYVNGVLVLNAASSGAYLGVGKAFLGGYAFSKTRTFQGTLDEVMLFDRALGRRDVQTLFLNAAAPSSYRTCGAIYTDRVYPDGFYQNLAGESKAFVYCSQGQAAPPHSFAAPTSALAVAPLFYYSFNTDLKDLFGLNNPTVRGSGLTVNSNGRIRSAIAFPASQGPYLEIGFLPQNFFTGSWTYVFWVRKSEERMMGVANEGYFGSKSNYAPFGSVKVML